MNETYVIKIIDTTARRVNVANEKFYFSDNNSHVPSINDFNVSARPENRKFTSARLKRTDKGRATATTSYNYCCRSYLCYIDRVVSSSDGKEKKNHRRDNILSSVIFLTLYFTAISFISQKTGPETVILNDDECVLDRIFTIYIIPILYTFRLYVKHNR